MEQSQETELKLVPNSRLQAKLLSIKPIKDVDRVTESIRGLLGAGQFNLVAENVDIISDEYFDTEALELFETNAVLRVRRTGTGGPTVVLKMPLEQELGLLKRREYTKRVDETEYRKLVSTSFAGLIDNLIPELTGKKLSYKLKVRNERRNLELKRGTEAYCLSIDTYGFIAGLKGRTLGDYIEVELEARSDAAAERLSALKRDVKKALPEFGFATGSKYQRGVRALYINRPPWVQWLAAWSSTTGLGWLGVVVSALTGAIGIAIGLLGPK